MITVTLGTIPYPFNRAVQWLNLLLEQEIITEPVFLQYGVSDIKALSNHQLVTAVPLLPAEELAEKIEASRFVISHAGQGSTRKLALQDKSFVILPRLAEHGEHVDDHQLLFAEGVESLGVTVCLTVEALRSVIKKPPASLKKDLFSGPKLSDFLVEKYPSHSIPTSRDYYPKHQPAHG